MPGLARSPLPGAFLRTGTSLRQDLKFHNTHNLPGKPSALPVPHPGGASTPHHHFHHPASTGCETAWDTSTLPRLSLQPACS
ncbi:hypothetical protein DV515_00006692 [Chloebia gouldiae]|uniref:Uncharacterized protein n=1 Tax=Chloebia gouldiae TaxID=44316 RepID=A0A3L8SJ85_CHLGU|nr:hypothetical protein DV515_00006692 [Chloebia gouldiae]